MDEQLIEQLYREYWDCMINKDIQGLSEIMIVRGDFTLVKESGCWKLESSEASTY